MDVSISERLSRALSETGTTQQDLADRLGVVKATVSHWMSGRNELSIKTAEKIADLLGIRAAWLAFNEGPMRDAPDAITTVPPPERVSTPPPQPPARAMPPPSTRKTRAA